MINLLNPAQKRQLRAARRNTIWRRYLLLIAGSAIAINIVFGITASFIAFQEKSSQDSLDTNNSELKDSYKKDKQNAQDFRRNLAAAKTIITSETNYSDVILSIAAAVPSGCVLQNLALNNSSFGVAQSFAFKCQKQSDSLRLKNTLQAKTDLFQKVNIVSTINNPTDLSPYKNSIIISAILLKPSKATS